MPILSRRAPQTSVGDQELSVDDGIDPARDAAEEEEAAPAEGVVGDGAVGLDVLEVVDGLDAVARRDQLVLVEDLVRGRLLLQRNCS